MRPNESGVEYRDAVGYEGYLVGTDGSVWSCWERFWFKGQGKTGSGVCLSDKWKRLKPTDVLGYLVVCLRKGEKRYSVKVHRLVLEAFVGPALPGDIARHYPDRNKHNNNLNNLVWGPPVRNAADREEHGMTVRGEDHPNTTLTNEAVLNIHYLKSFGIFTNEDIGRIVGAAKSTVGNISTGRHWRHLHPDS